MPSRTMMRLAVTFADGTFTLADFGRLRVAHPYIRLKPPTMAASKRHHDKARNICQVHTRHPRSVALDDASGAHRSPSVEAAVVTG